MKSMEKNNMTSITMVLTDAAMDAVGITAGRPSDCGASDFLEQVHVDRIVR